MTTSIEYIATHSDSRRGRYIHLNGDYLKSSRNSKTECSYLLIEILIPNSTVIKSFFVRSVLVGMFRV